MKMIYPKVLFLFLCSLFLASAYSEQWDKNITTKIDVESFWDQVKETRKKKYGIDKEWDKNMDYCSHFAEKIALSKGEGLIMSKLIKYANKCHKTLNLMTNYFLEEK